ncbi:unnamed protein product [Linum trigynum]|uniref:Uncharacterized protein n=1 Tax=Linum trigynum TaxID=586398 RepID=A0AAV2CPB6_9ROSI
MYIVWRKNHNCSFLNGIISRKITKGGLSIADWLMVEEENEDDTDEHMRVPLNDEQEQGSRSSMGKLKIHRSLAAGFYRVQIRVEQSWSLISWSKVWGVGLEFDLNQSVGIHALLN